MEEKYVPISLGEMMPELDMDAFKAYIEQQSTDHLPKIETSSFLLAALGIDPVNVKNKELFVRNYIHITVTIRKHLLEINALQHVVEKQLKQCPDADSYEYKKLQYYLKLYEKARDEIYSFVIRGLDKYVTNRHYDLIDRGEYESAFSGPHYDYQFNKEYYNPNFDYSTYVKFYSLPGVSLLEFLPNIKKHIELKKSSIQDYNEEIIRIVDENDLVTKMSSRVSDNYHIHTRKEIFESMATLFVEKKYLAFISMATIQIEGIFYDLICIKFGKKENQGTLVEKVERAFCDNHPQMLTLYPYFAFDVPRIRNEIAHKGIVENRDLKMTAYELVLDLNCVLSLTENASTDKFKQFILISQKLEEINVDDFESQGEYNTAIARCLLMQLFMSSMIEREYFWDVLITPDSFDEEMEYYRPDDLQEDEIYLKDIVHTISGWTRKDVFWKVITDELTECIKNPINVDGKFIKMIERLRDCLIKELSGDAKRNCCKANGYLGRIKELRKQKSEGRE